MTEPPETHVHPAHGGNALKPLTKKLGPAPVYVYVIVIVGGYVLYRYYAASKSGNTVGGPSTPNASTDTVEGTGDTGADFSSGGQTGGLVAGTNTATPIGPTSNAAWAAAAIKLLTSQGRDAATVNNAVYAYVNKKQLTAAQRVMIVAALAQLGPLPQGALPVLSIPNPAPPKPKPKPVKPSPPSGPTKPHPPGGGEKRLKRGVKIQTRQGDTLNSISAFYYGTTSKAAFIKSHNAGKGLGSGSDKIKTGTLLWIPPD